MRNILGPVGIGVEHDHAQRITLLPGIRSAMVGFIVGAVDVGLGERRNNRGPFTCTQLPLYAQRLYRMGRVWESHFWHGGPAFRVDLRRSNVTTKVVGESRYPGDQRDRKRLTSVV